ncbi:MAG TPA: PLP-dependent aminotransferase family protein [Polyangia bacterium]|jgi:2-aminoadipate transaminase
MSFPYGYSTVARTMRPSPIRELFKLIQRPGMISFAGGLPDPAVFPVAQFAGCADVLASAGPTALQYGASEGYAPLVDFLAARMEQPLGRAIRPEEIVIGSGSQQIMDMLARVLVDPGDVIVVEAPTYPGALHTFRNCGARFALVPCDDGGMIVDALPEVLARVRAETGRPAKLIYSIVNFSNPSGACLAGPRRARLAAIAAAHGVPVLEDDPYGELRWEGAALPTVFAQAERGVIFASSFSKILAPGTRVAWAIGDAEIIRKMVVVKQGLDLCTSMVSQVLVAEYCRRGLLDRHLTTIRAHYAAKARAMAAALARELPAGAASYASIEGGFFFWLRFARGDSQAVFARALERGVAFLPGAAFYPDPAETVGAAGDGSAQARLCFTFADPAAIDEGCRRLAAALAG